MYINWGTPRRHRVPTLNFSSLLKDPNQLSKTTIMAIDTESPVNTTPPGDDEKGAPAQNVTMVEHVKGVNDALARTDAYLDDRHVDLGWRTWLVVFVTMFAYASDPASFYLKLV
jgi:hypothetical protein